MADTQLIDRDLLLSEKSNNGSIETNFSMPFITSYSHQHYVIKKFVHKHWHILKNYHDLGKTLPDLPQVVFRGVSSLRDMVAPNVCDPQNTKLMFFQNMTGFYKCKKCSVCSVNGISGKKTTQFSSHSIAQVFQIRTFITCSTPKMVYLLICPSNLFGLQYIGRTIRPLQVRPNEHIGNIRRGFKGHLVSRHYLEVHNKNPSGTCFLATDKLKLHWKGGSRRREISKLEMSWS